MTRTTNWTAHTPPTQVILNDGGEVGFVFKRKKALAPDQIATADVLTQAGMKVFISESGQLDRMIPYGEWKEGRRELRMLSPNTIITMQSHLRKYREAASRVTDPEIQERLKGEIAILESILSPYVNTKATSESEDRLRELIDLMEKHGLKAVPPSTIQDGVTTLPGVEPPPDASKGGDEDKG